MYAQYRNRAAFYLVYIREAHPDDGWRMAINEQQGIHVVDPRTSQERETLADRACTELHLDFPAVADGMDNKVGVAYSGWPDRIYVIRPDGTVGFKTGPGPWGFDPDALARYLSDTLGAPAASTTAPASVPDVRNPPAIGAEAPAVEGRTIDGRTVSLADLKGKVVLVDFWATWCPPCRAALPGLNQLYQKQHTRGFEILGISLDGESTGTDLKTVRRFTAEHHLGWPVVCDGQGWDSPIAGSFGVTSLPTTVLIGRDGRVIATGLEGDGLAKQVEALTAGS